MTGSALTAKMLIATIAGALALAGGAAASGGPTLIADTGCSTQCITKALVTATASSAEVEVVTSVPASVTVSVAKAGTAPGGLTSGQAPHLTVPPFVTTRTIVVPRLEPATTYRIVVTAKDIKGRTATRVGTFVTRAVQVAVETPDPGLSAGLGCKAACIERALLRNDGIVPGRVHLEWRTSVPATVSLSLSAKTISGATLHFFQHVTGSRKTEHRATFDGLLTGTTYQVTAKAKDAEGHTRVEEGSFRTRSAVATVIFHKLKVIDDADKGGNAGEISFDYAAGDEVVGSNWFRRIDSGETVAARTSGAGRPGVMFTVSADRRRTLDLWVGGNECDWQRLSRCPREANFGGYPTDVDATAKLTFDLRDAIGSEALPPAHGSGLPAGHGAYPIWETTSNYLKFRVYATVDVRLV